MTFGGENLTDESFAYNPDPSAVCELMNRTWPRPGWEYTPELLSAYIARPTADPSLTLGLYCGERLAGYLAYVPYRVRYAGREHRVVYGTFWTADPQFRGRSVAFKLHRLGLARAGEKGYAGYVSITHHGTHADLSNRLVMSHLCKRFQLIHTFSQLMGTPQTLRRRTAAVPVRDVQPYEPALREKCLRLLASVAESTDLSRIVADEDVDYVLQGRPNTRTWVYVDRSSARALVNVICKRLVRDRPSFNAYFEHVAFGDLGRSERVQFLGSVLRDPFWDGIDAACAPIAGYFDQVPFAEAGFYKAPKKFNLYFLPLDGSLEVKPVSSFYLDVF